MRQLAVWPNERRVRRRLAAPFWISCAASASAACAVTGGPELPPVVVPTRAEIADIEAIVAEREARQPADCPQRPDAPDCQPRPVETLLGRYLRFMEALEAERDLD